jgi:hypothetical protein
MTVVNYWKKWAILGIAIPSENYQGRYKRICSLEELGIDVPEPEKATTQGEINGNEGGSPTTTN